MPSNKDAGLDGPVNASWRRLRLLGEAGAEQVCDVVLKSVPLPNGAGDVGAGKAVPAEAEDADEFPTGLTVEEKVEDDPEFAGLALPAVTPPEETGVTVDAAATATDEAAHISGEAGACGIRLTMRAAPPEG